MTIRLEASISPRTKNEAAPGECSLLVLSSGNHCKNPPYQTCGACGLIFCSEHIGDHGC